MSEEVANYHAGFGPPADPFGRRQHEPGAKLDAGKLRPELVFSGFPTALALVTAVATFGARKYSDHGWQQVPGGIRRYQDAHLRHLMAAHGGETHDPETGLPHYAHAAWNALAVLELMERERADAHQRDGAARLGG